MARSTQSITDQVLLRRLESSCGISGCAIRWFLSYLSKRSQRVCYEVCYSKRFDLVYGVPQGSCLGPFLFTVYASKLFQVIRARLPDVHDYVDDTQLYLSFQL